mgnify:CR=1 FL=1
MNMTQPQVFTMNPLEDVFPDTPSNGRASYALHMARGEGEGFLVAVRAGDAPLAGLSAWVRCDASDVEWAAWHVGLVPFSKNTIHIGSRSIRAAAPGVLPEYFQKQPRADVPAGETRSLYIAARTAPDAPPGVYEGTVELEAELLSGAIDIAVHSAKDMPMTFPKGLGIGAVLSRADARDTFVTCDGKKLSQLAPGSVVGTSSLRRELQIKETNPEVQVRMLRGNVQTRLRKLKEGQYDGIILAAAGIERLGYEKEDGFFYEYLDPERFLPAAGQGILAVESRTDDTEMAEMLAAIHDEEAACLLAGLLRAANAQFAAR